MYVTQLACQQSSPVDLGVGLVVGDWEGAGSLVVGWEAANRRLSIRSGRTGNVGESIGHVCDSIGLPAGLTGGLGGGLGGGGLGGGGLAGGGLGGCEQKAVNKGLGEQAMLVSR